ncbi:hypothetical protein B4U80_14150 [Leptotrombidium deliense]|uniref:Uncharacterized protein n=1 Tax=Leptotrombidium deliense TaxID=299467 RepID=A0A443S1H6_9ACAR|nr:hypothetical protein B4U80_14150 [Leptotrombidium deliense]
MQLMFQISPETENRCCCDVSVQIRIFGYLAAVIGITPEQLAEAGFFDAGNNDFAMSHYCAGICCGWEPNEYPWFTSSEDEDSRQFYNHVVIEVEDKEHQITKYDVSNEDLER